MNVIQPCAVLVAAGVAAATERWCRPPPRHHVSSAPPLPPRRPTLAFKAGRTVLPVPIPRIPQPPAQAPQMGVRATAWQAAACGAGAVLLGACPAVQAHLLVGAVILGAAMGMFAALCDCILQTRQQAAA